MAEPVVPGVRALVGLGPRPTRIRGPPWYYYFRGEG